MEFSPVGCVAGMEAELGNAETWARINGLLEAHTASVTAQHELDTETEAHEKSGHHKTEGTNRETRPPVLSPNPHRNPRRRVKSLPAAGLHLAVRRRRPAISSTPLRAPRLPLRSPTERLLRPVATMDLGTENRLAALLLEEARRLRAEAEKEGVHAYLHKPNVRHRPNSRFLTATVLGVQQANRVVEVNEMWRARGKELELESKMETRTSGGVDSRSQKRKSSRDQSFSSKNEQDRPYGRSCSSRDPRSSSYSDREDSTSLDREDGLGDDEIEDFLRSRVKRGRGAIGSRMDEPGPYLTAPSSRQDELTSRDARVKEDLKRRVYGPEKPLFLRSKSSDEEPSTSKEKHREKKKNNSGTRERKEEKRRHKHRHHKHRSQS